ncbi:MAG: hypothetical protein Q8K63_13415, partial [Acidimicrobiales bacterium]|nr:hypothetical protein [Acidimicrobiales bacterium]
VAENRVFRPSALPAGVESDYCAVAGEWALRVGRLGEPGSWVENCVAELAGAEFLARTTTA